IADDTLIIFTSDHGATFEAGNTGASNYHDSNRPFRGGKRTLWEGGVRVPGLVRWTGHVPAGKTSDEPIHMIDVFPTVLAAAGGRPSRPATRGGRTITTATAPSAAASGPCGRAACACRGWCAGPVTCRRAKPPTSRST